MRFGILGPLVVADDQGRELALGGRRQRAVLAILLLHAGEVVPSDRLIDQLWDGRAPATAAKTLQVYVSNLRKALGGGVLLTRASGYVLQVEPDCIDSGHFRSLVDKGRCAVQAGEMRGGAARLREALGLWRGPALADFAYESFAQSEVARLEELREGAVEDRIDADLAQGAHAALVGELDALVREHPLRERLTAQLMLALYRSGRQAEALDAYQRARLRLQEQLGLEPGPALKALQMQVLAQSSELDVDLQARDEDAGAVPSGEPPAAGALAVPRAELKVVTVLSIELAGVAAVIERNDPEQVQALLAPYQEYLRSELERFGGTVLQIVGVEMTALFGAPMAHEDDPERAVRAALSIRDWAAERGHAKVRIAISAGEALITIDAVPTWGDTMGAGQVINLATRIRGHASLNGILVGEHACRATRGWIEYRAAPPVVATEGSRPVAVWEAVRALSAPGPVAETRTPFVGRKREFESVASALDRAREERSCQLVTLVGVPGIGKSRLVYELHEAVRRRPEAITWHQGRSLPYGEGASYWALGEIIKQQAGILNSDTPERAAEKLRVAVRELMDADEEWIEAQLAPLVGLSPKHVASGERSEAGAAWRRFLEAIADEVPTVLVFEDVHWSDDGLLNFIDDLADRATGVPLLVIVTARPELLDRRPSWGGGKPNALALSLPPLLDQETTRLLVSLFDRPLIDSAVLGELLTRAGGNPLYAEQYTTAWRAKDGLERPPETLHALISARLDALTLDEKQLLQSAAVIGSVFWLGAVEALGGCPSGQMKELLHRLERKEFVRRARRSSVAGEAEYAFRHALLRDVAYGQIPRTARSGKHERTAAWIEAIGRPEDHAELLAHHYLSALEYAEAAGEAQSPLAERARVALRAAGDRALSLASYAAAWRFYSAALDLWPEDDPDRVWLLVDAGRARYSVDLTGIELLERGFEQLRARGDTEGAAEVAVEVARRCWLSGDRDAAYTYIDRALELTDGRRDSRARAYALVERAGYHSSAHESLDALRVSEEALLLTDTLGMDELRVRGLHVRGGARVLTGDLGGMEDSRRAIALARTCNAYSRLIIAELNLHSDHFFAGDLAGATRSLDEARRDIDRYATSDQRHWLRVVEAHEDVLHGRWKTAVRSLDAIIAERESGRAPYYLDPACRALRASLELGYGNLTAAAADSEAAVDGARITKDPQLLAPALVIRAIVLLAQGKKEEASANASEVLTFTPVLVPALQDLAPAATTVELAWLLRDLDRSAELLPALAAAPRTPWVELGGAICTGEIPRAVELATKIGSRSIEAYTQLHAAEQLIDTGHHPGEAASLLSQALEFHRSVGADRYILQAEAHISSITSATRSKPAISAVDHPTQIDTSHRH